MALTALCAFCGFVWVCQLSSLGGRMRGLSRCYIELVLGVERVEEAVRTFQ